MNKLLNPISWSAYLETVAILAIIYYAFIGWKYFRPEINKLIARLKGENEGAQALPAALQYQAAAPEENHAQQTPAATAIGHSKGAVEYQEPGNPVQELGQRLTVCIGEASGKPFAPPVLIPKLKKLMNDYPGVAASHERDEINALVVRECEKTGTALLSESEVDMWWSA